MKFTFYITVGRGAPPAIQINIDTEALGPSSACNDTNGWHKVGSTGNISMCSSSPNYNTNDTSTPPSSPLAPLTQLSACDTHPNLPNSLDDPGYHIMYGCDIHGQQNHYGPYCRCSPMHFSVSMPPWLPDGSWPLILPDGSIPWPPQAGFTRKPMAITPAMESTSKTAANIIPAASPMESTSTLTMAVNPMQGGPFYTVFIGTRMGVFDDW